MIALGGLLLVILLAPMSPAAADDDLADYLERSRDADFRGTGVLICTWGADSAAASYDVTRRDGMTMVHGPGGDLMLSDTLTALRSGDEWYAVEFADRSEWRLSDRYRLGAPAAVTRLGRDATEYLVYEGERPRVRLVVDAASTVPLLTEVFTVEGRVFRSAALVEFGDVPGAVPAPEPGMPARKVGMATPGATLPGDLAGYRRVDVYTVRGGAVQAFYSDGLFAFSVFEGRRGPSPEAFAAATSWRVGDGVYRRVITPSQVWIHWNAPDRSYVMVGDLPPDHAEAVLRGLPPPGDRGVLVRLWRRLFG